MRILRRASQAAQVSELRTPQGLQGPVPAVAQGRQAVTMALRAAWHLILFRRSSVVSLKKGGSVRPGETALVGPCPETPCRWAVSESPASPLFASWAGGPSPPGPPGRCWPTSAAARGTASSPSCLRSPSRLIAARVRAGGKYVGRRAGWLASLQGRQAAMLPSAAQSAQRGLAPAFVHGSPIPGGGAWGGAGWPRARHAAQRRFVGAPHWSQWAPLGTPIRRLLVRTMYAARASVLEMRCLLSSSPLGTGPTFAGSGRHGGLSAGAPWAMVGEEPSSSPSDQPLASSSEPR